ncbi:MAG: SDR family NAD(P)-dependent oxidoreductase [Desulfomonilaceae bacterium]
MANGNEYPLIAFVWNPEDWISTILETSHRVGCKAILDLTSAQMDAETVAMLRPRDFADAVHVKILPEWLTDARLDNVLQSAGAKGVWVELNPVLIRSHPRNYLDRLVQLSARLNCYPIVGDLDLIGLIVHEYPGLRDIVLKGAEAAGFVSSENIFALFAAVRHISTTIGNPKNLIVWGGVATPEAAAAFLAVGVGCKGIVFESLHWLTDLCVVDQAMRDKISTLRPDHTDLVGLNLRVPCRLFNKGNSLAIKELKVRANSVCGEEIREEDRRLLAQRIQESWVHPRRSSFSREELIPLGIEAAFAQSFVRRFGASGEEAMDGFLTEIARLCALAAEKEKAFINSPAAEDMGTEYALVQGAMSCITDLPEFALNVSEAGALPTIALGSMPKLVLENRLGNLREIMGDRPFAVNVITLDENPHREEQLEWVHSEKPKFVVIAAGDPLHARQLLDNGLEVIYVAPNEKLVELAFGTGVRYVICEGNEAGGHVGEYSTLTFAQIVLDWRNRDPDFFDNRHVILAGGICDRETAFMAAMLGADAIQAGTCYLATTEIVETGALSHLYQRKVLEARPGSTVVTGEGTGLRVRSLMTQKIEAVCRLERDFVAGSMDKASFRREMEQLIAGSLLIAARGFDKPGGSLLDEEVCIEQGQFMSGACAGVLSEVRSLSQLHFELIEARMPQGLPFLGPVRPSTRSRSSKDTEPLSIRSAEVLRRAYRSPDRERVAITGMSVVNSLGKSPEEIWSNCIALKSGVVAVPASKWDHETYYDPRPGVPEKTYSNVAAFQDLEVSRKELGISPQDFRTMSKSTKTTLWLAERAIEASGILGSEIPRHRIAVLVSQNAAECASTLTHSLIRASATDIVKSLQTVISMTPETCRAAEEAVKNGRAAIDDTSLTGRLNSAAAGFICNKYGFQGPSFAVSAACSTGLVALFSACQMVRTGIIDAAVVGGAEEPLTPLHFLIFSALSALAGLSDVERLPEQSSRPFDAQRDGMVLGEGGGMIVIERESVAIKRGAKVYAHITGIGGSSNNFGMIDSSRVTQAIAIRASFDDPSYGPDEVDLVECHATGTMQGDLEEVLTLKEFFNPSNRTVLTSFKSQIGHTLGASAVNGLIRGVMAMNAGIFPPTLNYENPDPAINLESAGFSVISEPADWKFKDGLARRLQLNAFGFGGSNYILQLEKISDAEDVVLVSSAGVRESRKRTGEGVPFPSGVHFFTISVRAKSYRVAVVAETEEEAESLIEKTQVLARNGVISPRDTRTLAKTGVFLGQEKTPPAPLAFVFAGQGSQYKGMGRDLYKTFPVIRECMDRAAQVAEFDLLKIMFYGSEEDLQNTRWQQPALFTLEYALAQYLLSLGVRPTALAGHSLGQGTALCVAGVYSFEDGFRLVNKRAECMDKASRTQEDPGAMMAVDAPLEYLEAMIDKIDNIHVTNINSPRQIVLGGNTRAVKALGEKLKKEGYRRTVLPVSMAFHLPNMQCAREELGDFMASMDFHSPEIPVISNTTMQPFPRDTSEIKKILLAHLECPVYWMQNIRTLWDDYGIRLFVELGPGSILSGLVMDILDKADCIHTCAKDDEHGVYRTAVAQLFAKGHLSVDAQHRTIRLLGLECEPDPSVFESQNPTAITAQNLEGTDTVVLNQITDFVRRSLGHYVKPALLDAIRREHNPKYSENELDVALSAVFKDLDTASLPAPQLQRTGEPEGIPRRTPRILDEDPSPQDTDELMEAVIQIIMDATGYERNEIEPCMDLKEDLSIRSSRLPVLVDRTESHFKIQLHLSDFTSVRTVSDFAEKLRAVVSTDRQKDAQSDRERIREAPIQRTEQESLTGEDQQPIRRLVCREVSLPQAPRQIIELTRNNSVVVFAAGNCSNIGDEILAAFAKNCGDAHLQFGSLAEVADGTGFDLRQMQSAAKAADRLADFESLAGIIFVIHDDSTVKNVDEVSGLLSGLFVVLKAFLNSPAKRFATLIHTGQRADWVGTLVYEGVVGMFLSLTHEYPSVQFRVVRMDENTDLSAVLAVALDRNQPVMEAIFRCGEVLTRQWEPALSTYRDGDGSYIAPGDVIVLSGGATGITYQLALILAPLGCRLVFLGRTRLDSDIEYQQWLSEVTVQGDRQTASARKAVEIVRNMEDLRAAGIEATYYRCDVTDATETESVIAKILQRYGRIDGVVHGAGILRDALAKQMSPEEFFVVVDTKLRGAANLHAAAKNPELKFFVCLSSVAAIVGNPGQVNYTAANRAMSGFVALLRAQNPSLMSKSLMLPPIEGVGMAADNEIREKMKRANAGYVHVDELAALFGRELIMGTDDGWVLLMRSLPRVPTVLLHSSTWPPDSREMVSGTCLFLKERFPMIDSLAKVDLHKGELHATRVFSLEKDLWLADHRPFPFLKHPLVSAIMVIEAFMEAARLLYPHLPVRAIRAAEFLDLLECPPGFGRHTEIFCHRIPSSAGEVVCEVSLFSSVISPTGRVMDGKCLNHKAQVVLGSETEFTSVDSRVFPVRKEELDGGPMSHQMVLQSYRNSLHKGRYRVLETMEGTGPDSVRARFTYRESQDFAPPLRTWYQYSPYVLEALMQICGNFYIGMRKKHEQLRTIAEDKTIDDHRKAGLEEQKPAEPPLEVCGRTSELTSSPIPSEDQPLTGFGNVIPHSIKEIGFAQSDVNDESIVLEGRMTARNDEGLVWTARGIDRSGQTLMWVRDLVLRWVST